MKQKFLLSLSFLTIFFIQNIFATENIQKKYTFEYPAIEKQEGNFYKIIYKNLRNRGAEGTPLLPYYAADILLPQGSEISDVEIVKIEYYAEEKNIQIVPATKPLPLSKIAGNDSPVIPDENIYHSKNRYPKNAIGKLQTQYLGGYSIGGFAICPVEYYPAQNNVKFIKSITVNIHTQNTKKSGFIGEKTNYRPDIVKKVQRIVDNPEAINQYHHIKRYDNETDLLLITNQELLSSFQEYIDFKKSQGFVVEAITTEEIYANYAGEDHPEKIRNAIIDYYENKNLQYVILGGDADGDSGEEVIVPARGLSASAGGETENNIPADIYYSGLDGSWDSNGNGIFGEYDEFDIMAEVYVGRFCVDNPTEVANVINKHIKYQDEPVLEDIPKALMVGELLWTDPNTYGGDYKDEIAEGSSNHGYTTAGFTNNFSVSYLYERDGSWTINDVFNAFNNTGINIINHLGHSNVTYNMTMYNSSVSTANFTNDGIDRGFVFEYSQGCYCGSFDNRNSYGSYGTEDCFAEKITTLETGLVATIMNSRYGWGMKGSTDGASQYFDREFFDAIFGENMYPLGEANADSKEDNIANLDEGVMRWCAYETNLFGDPSMYLWTEQPGVITAGYTTDLALGSSQLTFTTDAPYARIGLMQNDQLIGRSIADENGDAVINLFDPVSAVEPISVSIIAPNKLRHLGTINVYTNQPYVTLSGYTLNDAAGNNNSEADYSETISLDVTLENVSDSYDAFNVHDSLYCNDPYITLSDSLELYGNIAALDSSFITGAFTFTVSDSVPDQHVANFSMHITGEDASAEDYTWVSDFAVTINAPALSIGGLTIDDSGSGNSDGILDPGETANLLVEVSNTGHADISGVEGVLSSASPWLTLNDSTDGPYAITTGGMTTLTFTVTADPATPIGTPASLTINVSDGNAHYTANSTKQIVIGEIPEYLISDGGTVNTCYGLFYDSGGPSGAYSNNENYTMTFVPSSSGNVIKADFLSFDVETGYDELIVYDGSSSSAPVIGSYDTGNPPGTIIATNVEGALTFTFNSDGSVMKAGWEAEITCVDMNEVVFVVTDGVDPLENASVTFAGSTLYTDASGEATFVVESGTYNYTITKTGYAESTGTLNVSTDMTETVVLDILTYDITFNIWEEDGTTPIDGDITFNGSTVPTSGGSHTFLDVEYGLGRSYSVDVGGTYYAIYAGVVDVTADKTVDVVMEPNVYDVSIRVEDESGAGVQGATVVIEKSKAQGTTNSTGIVNFELSVGSWSYTATHEGYSTGTGAVEVTGDEPSYSDTVVVSIESYTVTFNVEDDLGEALDAEVTFDGETQTASGGVCVFEAVEYSGDKAYSVEADECYPATGTVHLISDTTLTIELVRKSYAITIAVVDQDEAALSGVSVEVGNQSGITDASGEAGFSGLYKGAYGCIASKDGYTTYDETIEVVKDSTYRVMLTQIYTLRFEVTDEDENPISGATVTADTASKVTDNNGTCDLYLAAGEYDYTVSATNYNDYEGTADLTGGNTTVSVILIASSTGISDMLEEGLNIYPNPAQEKLIIEKESPEAISYELIDMAGKVVLNGRLESVKNTIDISAQAPGIYFIRLKTNDRYVHFKLMIE